tara:strand:- start:117 stop:890 length:774 start_codon:yes stop_codon:yes gene_type:complete
MKNKVVACIPSKNSAWILKQTLPHLSKFCHKIIIGDDGSTDDTYEVCSEYTSVEYYKRPERDHSDRQGGLQRQEILERAYKYDPDYFFCLDADEMPSPDIIDWINSLGSKNEEKNNLWTFPWVHLWTDENHYRVDSYNAGFSKVEWDPFSTDYRKGFFVRNIPDYTLKYDVNQNRVRPSNQPVNVPGSAVDVKDGPVILHYGKISEYFTSEQNWRDRAAWDKREKNANEGVTLLTHRDANSEKTLKLERINPSWKWD